MSDKSNSSWVVIVAALITTIGSVTTAFVHRWGRDIVEPIETNNTREAEQRIIGDSSDETGTHQSVSEIDLSGTWYMQTITEKTSHDPFKGLAIRYELFLTQDEKGITANGNKISEVFRGNVHEHSGKAKTPIRLTGSLSTDEFGQTSIKLSGEEDGLQRQAIAISFQLRMLNSSRISGTWSSNAANSKGTTVWIREDDWSTNGWNSL